MCRINQEKPSDRMQKVIDRLNGNGDQDQGQAQVIKINLEIPIVNATKYITSIRDFLSALIPKEKADGLN